MSSSQSRKLDQIEEENVRLENQLEQKQLDWETRDVELEELQVTIYLHAQLERVLKPLYALLLVLLLLLLILLLLLSP